ncbi:Hsp20/alpha crystallin family protein [Paenibacillus ginsengarvi]|uniref:Hsp20/alpha crystallin family protein n=1 Tax=Paenibacillus ginsengarvi TaxID=400777 RepID=A0A3B0CFP5_9BACL|nr:Hsp20/alpha crystallin family protein [Paenibacillus ginsengarvi]RKN84735.1 hypothetical protein D7M11_12150 [Paenibacillus ginsengarvi]
METQRSRNAPPNEERGFDWGQFEKLFDDLFPNAIPGMKGDSISRIGQFVRGIMDRSVAPNQSAPSSSRADREARSGLFQADVSETLKFVKIRVPIPEYVDPRKLQLFVNGMTFKIEGPLGNMQTFPLPAAVGLKSMQAEYRDQALYIKLHKKNGPGYKELFVRYP